MPVRFVVDDVWLARYGIVWATCMCSIGEMGPLRAHVVTNVLALSLPWIPIQLHILCMLILGWKPRNIVYYGCDKEFVQGS